MERIIHIINTVIIIIRIYAIKHPVTIEICEIRVPNKHNPVHIEQIALSPSENKVYIVTITDNFGQFGGYGYPILPITGRLYGYSTVSVTRSTVPFSLTEGLFLKASYVS